jgi:hypothetical protein
MKNSINRILAVGWLSVAFLSACISANAQGYGFDEFFATRTDVLCSPTNIIGGAGATYAGPLTNQWQFLESFSGGAKIDILATTNVGTSGGTMTCTVQVSTDTTNVATITNIAMITAPTLSTITNTYYGSTTLLSTNAVLIPGTLTTPTASSAGFATPYPADSPYTNGGAVTLSAGVPMQIGFLVQNQPRYLRTIWTPAGSATNWTVSAVLTARPSHY